MLTIPGRRPAVMAVAAGAALLTGLTACAKETPAAQSGDPTGPVMVKATDSECGLSRAEVKSGTSRFSITNGGSKVTEFYVYAEGDRVIGEVENIGPGLKRDLIVELPTGKYQAVCKPGMIGDGIRGDLTASGALGAQADEDTALKQASRSYQRYVNSQAIALEEQTTAFVTAVKAGDLARAKRLFPVARTYWERIEPVAETFGHLDPKIDVRVNDVEPGAEWTGFHRIEQGLWVSNTTKGMEKYAGKLLVDVKTLVAKAKVAKLNPLQLANGAKELLDEVATRKITGEEDRYSHTDLWDIHANVEGSQAAIQALRPALQQRDAALVTTLDTTFKAVFDAVGRYRQADGFKPYNLSQAEQKQLGSVVDALAEPVSKVAGVIGKK